MKLSLKNKKIWIGIFYFMSPYFPGNNFLELALIGSSIGVVAPFLPNNWDLGLVRSIIYLCYNAIAVIGLYLLQKNKRKLGLQDFFEILLMFSVLFFSGYIPEPYGTILLFVIGLYFLFKNGYHKHIMNYFKNITKRK